MVLLLTNTQTIDSNYAGLDYLMMANQSNGSNTSDTMTGEIDDKLNYTMVSHQLIQMSLEREEYSLTIENLGVKLYSGTKADRVSDSLGSSANGTNTGITLVTATSTAEQTTGAEENTLTPDTRGMGEYVVNTSSTLYGKTLTDVQFNIKKATGGDAPAAGEVVRARHYNSSNTLIHTYWTKDATTLPTSFAWTSETTLSGDTAYAVGDYFVCEFTETDGTSPTGQVKINRKANGSGTKWDSTNSGFINTYFSASNYTDTNRDIQFKITLSDSSAVKLGTGAYSFDGTDDYVKISNSLDAMVSGDFSVAGWVYFDNANTGTSHETILRKGSGSTYASPYHDFFLYQYNTGVSLTVNDGSTYQTLTGTAGTSTVGWHHVCVTRASNVYTLYVDGISNGTLSHTTSFGTQPWYFGCSENGTGTFERELYGKLDDWGCWSRVLTTTEISDLVNQSSPNTTSSGGTLNITSGGSTVLSTIDVGTTSDTKWVLRYKANFGTWSTNSYFHICLSDNNNPITSSQDELGVFYRNDSSSNNFGVHTVAGANPNSVNSQDQQTWSTSTSTDYYFEIVRESSTSAKVKFYGTDSTYTTVSSTSSYTSVSANCDGLDRIKIMENNASNTSGAVTISDIKFWNGVTSVSNDGALVSSLTNKSELKAYYTMDSLSLGATVTYSQDFNGSVTYLNSGAYTVSSTVSNAWNASIANTGHTGAETTIDLGTTIDGGSFVMDYTMKADNITNYVFFWLGLGSVSGAGYEDSQNFVGAMSTLQGSASNGDIRGGYKDSSATWNGGTNSAGNYFPAGTTRYCRLVKDGTTITAYIYPTEADRTAGTNATTSSAKTSSPATLSGLKYLQILVSNYNDGKTNTATIDDITIYSGVSVLTGCKNDFSATSALEGLTGVRTNSIFQQTDTPSYWWYNGTSWLLDGTTEKSFDYSSSSGWTTVGSLTTITDGWVNSGGAGNNADNRIYQNTGLTVNNTSWVCDFEFYYTNVDLESGLPVGFYSGTGTPMTANQDMIGIQFGNGGTLHLVYKDGSGSMTSTGSTSVSASTTYYCRLTRTSATEATLKIYTDSARTTQHGSTITQSSLPSSVQGLDYIQHSSTNNGGTGSGQSVWKVTNVKLQNGRTTWL